jgi:hypothetical protein
MNPMLRYGSTGEHVKTLQAALNIWPQRQPPSLAVDGTHDLQLCVGVPV